MNEYYDYCDFVESITKESHGYGYECPVCGNEIGFFARKKCAFLGIDTCRKCAAKYDVMEYDKTHAIEICNDCIKIKTSKMVLSYNYIYNDLHAKYLFKGIKKSKERKKYIQIIKLRSLFIMGV